MINENTDTDTDSDSYIITGLTIKLIETLTKTPVQSRG